MNSFPLSNHLISEYPYPISYPPSKADPIGQTRFTGKHEANNTPGVRATVVDFPLQVVRVNALMRKYTLGLNYTGNTSDKETEHWN